MKEFFSLKNINNIFKKLVLTTICLFVVAEYMPIHAEETDLKKKTAHADVTYEKSLSYDSGQYDLSLDIYLKTKSKYKFKSDAEQITWSDFLNGKFEVPFDGYYMIQAWGGDGGKGLTGKILIPGMEPPTGYGGKGGKGGYIHGLVYLYKGTSLDIAIGKKVMMPQILKKSLGKVAKKQELLMVTKKLRY